MVKNYKKISKRLLEEYNNYSPENDPSGAYGQNLAERVLKQVGYDHEKVPKLTGRGGLEITSKNSHLSEEQKRINLHYTKRIKDKYFNNN